MLRRILIFDISGGKQWIGGVYYYQNITFSVLQNRRLQDKAKVILFIPEELKNKISIKPVRKKLKIVFYKSILQHRLQKLCYFICPAYKVAYNCMLKIKRPFIKRHIRWIPDFQHNHYPQYFQEEELAQRIGNYRICAESSDPLVLSSLDAKNDFEQFYMKHRPNVYVIPFVSYIEPEIKMMTPQVVETTLEKYNVKSRNYIFVANQFWQHKNHKVIFEMLALAKKENRLSGLQFVFTGELKDYRCPEYLEELKTIIRNNDLNDRIKILGFIDRLEQLILMKESLILLQPSLFEGWGTVVEDGKVLDKTILLSDIPVHREQMNEKCRLFNPHDSRELLEKLEAAIIDVPADDIEKGIKDMYSRAAEYSKGLEDLLIENI